jgi:hypothetical protein
VRDLEEPRSTRSVENVHGDHEVEPPGGERARQGRRDLPLDAVRRLARRARPALEGDRRDRAFPARHFGEGAGEAHLAAAELQID